MAKFDLDVAVKLTNTLFPSEATECAVMITPLLPANARRSNFLALGPSIEKATEYLNDATGTADANAALVLHYLERRFQTRFTPAAKKVDSSGMQPGPLLGLPPVKLASTAFFWEQALHCKVNPFNQEQLNRFEQIGPESDPRWVPLVMLAVQWAGEQGCVSGEQVAQLMDRYGSVMAAHIQTAVEVDLTYIYGLAMMYYGGQREKIKPAWTFRLRKAQRSDGGWAEKAGDAQSSRHATALALWALLENAQAPRQVAWSRQSPVR